VIFVFHHVFMSLAETLMTWTQRWCNGKHAQIEIIILWVWFKAQSVQTKDYQIGNCCYAHIIKAYEQRLVGLWSG